MTDPRSLADLERDQHCRDCRREFSGTAAETVCPACAERRDR